jgi:DUF2948 family protein
VSNDATFDEGREAPLNLGAGDGDDLAVISSLIQDSVFPVTEMKWNAAQNRFALLLNRFRWEDEEAARLRGRAFERVQSLLVVDNVLGVASHGIERGDKDMVHSLLSIAFESGEDCAGAVLLTLAGGGAIRLNVEALEVSIRDVTRPYQAPSHKAPEHQE